MEFDETEFRARMLARHSRCVDTCCPSAHAEQGEHDNYGTLELYR